MVHLLGGKIKMLKTPVTGDLLGHFVVLKLSVALGVVAGWFFPPHQSVINFVRATVHAGKILSFLGAMLWRAMHVFLVKHRSHCESLVL